MAERWAFNPRGVGSIPITPIGTLRPMAIGWVLIILAVICALLFSWIIGLILFVVGAVFLLAPNMPRR